MGVSLGGMFGRSRQSGSQSSDRTFNTPEAAQMRDLAIGRVDQFGSGPWQQFFTSQLQRQPGEINPWINQFIDSTAGIHRRGIGEGLSQIRSAGARGGRARSELNQGRFITEGQQNLDNLVLQALMGQANQDQAVQMGAAQQLQQSELQGAQIAAALAELLSGTTGQQAQRGINWGLQSGLEW